MGASAYAMVPMPVHLSKPPTPAYVLGILSNLERQLAEHEKAFDAQQKIAGVHQSDLKQTLARLDADTKILSALQNTHEKAARMLAEHNQQAGELLQQIGFLQNKSDEMRKRMGNVRDTDSYRRMRRSRAEYSIKIEDRQKKLDKLQPPITESRQTMETTHQQIIVQKDALRLLRNRLTELQTQQVPASLCFGIFGDRIGYAHACAFLDAHEVDAPRRDRSPQTLPLRKQWEERVLEAVHWVRNVHLALNAGQYAVEDATSWIGGRAQFTNEALYALAALGRFEEALQLYALAHVEEHFFHHIYEPFRGGCLGMFLSGRHHELWEVLRLHRYSPGVRGAYAQAYADLLQGDAQSFNQQLEQIAIAEWRMWQQSGTPAVGLVNVNVLGLLQMAQLRDFSRPRTYPATLPWPLCPL